MTTGLKERPSRLYKYQPLSIYAIRNLKNNHVYFNSPKAFNDPFDCVHSILYNDLDDNLIRDISIKASKDKIGRLLVKKLLDDSITEKELIEYYKRNYTTGSDTDNKTQTNINNDSSARLLTLEREITDPEKFKKAKSLAKSRLFSKAVNFASLAMETARSNLTNGIGVACFSEKNDDLLMWSYYSEGHRGFCLEFDTNEEPFDKLCKVDYVKEIPKLNPSTIIKGVSDANALLTTLVATKYHSWSHEAEWRVVHKEACTSFSYNSNALTGIYIGAEMDQTNLEILALILKGQNDEVKFYRMVKKEGEFKIEAKEFIYHTHLEGRNIFKDYLLHNYADQTFSLSDLIESDIRIDPNLIELYLRALLRTGDVLKEDGNEYLIKS